MAEISTDDLAQQAKKFNLGVTAEIVKRLLEKGLKPDWSEEHLAGFLSVMASLKKQTKEWSWPSDSLYESLDPKALTVLVVCLEENRPE